MPSEFNLHRQFSLRNALVMAGKRPISGYLFTGGLVAGFLRRTGAFFSPPLGLINAK